VAESRRRRIHIGRPGRVAGVRTLSIVGTILALVSVLAIWVNRLVLETDTWTDTSVQLLQDDEIRQALAANLTDSLFANVDVAGQLQTVLPPAVQPLAGPAAAGLRQFAEERANIFLQRPRVVAAWEQANRAAHQQFVRIVTGNSQAIQTQNDQVVLLLRPLLADLAAQVGLEQVESRIPENAGTIVIMNGNQLSALQTVIHILDVVATWLWAIALICWALAIYLSPPGRRLKTIRGVGFGILFVGLAVLAIIRVGGNLIVENLVKIPSNQTAAEHVFAIMTEALKTTAWALVAIALILVIGSWLSGPGDRATSFRRRSAPLLEEHPEFYFGTFAFIALLVIIWGPVRATRNLVGILVLVGLAALGLWAFRRLTLAEFPDEPRRPLNLRGAMSWSRTSSEEKRIAALERLSALHDQGVLSDAEFKAQKAQLLGAD
jgi:putative oligomerization/nucleic acid binding protein